MGINIVREIDNMVKIKNVIISVSNKDNLDDFVGGLLNVIPDITIYSTGGTFEYLKGIVDDRKRLIQISEYTKQPETQGGLVKTLDFKVYLGILTERYNPYHEEDLKRTGSVRFDMVVVNLYPFEKVISKDGSTIEEARANIDIGGPTMIRAAAKNYLRVAVVVDPNDYESIIQKLIKGNGALTLKDRFELAKKAFYRTAEYDKWISEYLAMKSEKDLVCYNFVDQK
ncbi:MAG: hypothetical protein N2746_09405 [Deltaproteobacteria bacterium]|nr:hypothetical protein [Deltaproteobacteria bacterium]